MNVRCPRIILNSPNFAVLPMGVSVTKSWSLFRVTLFAAGLGLLLASPAELYAGCNHSFPDTFAEPTQGLLPTSDLDSPVWLRVFHAVNSLFDSQRISTAPTKSTPCTHCPVDPALPTNRCNGPECSGGPPPAAVPISTPASRSNDPATLSALGQASSQDSLPCRPIVDARLPISSHLEAIFRPPRSI